MAHDLRSDRLLFLGMSIGEGLKNTIAQFLFIQIVVGLQPLGERQIDAEVAIEVGRQAGHVPLFFQAFRRDVLADDSGDNVMANSGNALRDVVNIHQPVALLVDDLALIVGDVIVLKQLLANVEVTAFNLALGILDRL